MKIGFLGCGNMAKAIIGGIIKSGFCEKENIFASAKNYEKLKDFCENSGITAAKSNCELCEKCDVVLLCTKPQMFEKVFSEIKDIPLSDKLFISIAAGKSTDYIASYLGKNAKIIRVMPNLNAACESSMSAICANENCTDENLKIAENIFSAVGEVVKIAENDFSVFSATACCSPAFTFMYIDALANAGEKFGLSKECAYKSAINSVIGSAKMLLSSTDDAKTLIKKVCSPGGTTIEGVNVLQSENFRKTIENAVKASYEKDKIL